MAQQKSNRCFSNHNILNRLFDYNVRYANNRNDEYDFVEVNLLSDPMKSGSKDFYGKTNVKTRRVGNRGLITRSALWWGKANCKIILYSQCVRLYLVVMTMRRLGLAEPPKVCLCVHTFPSCFAIFYVVVHTGSGAAALANGGITITQSAKCKNTLF